MSIVAIDDIVDNFDGKFILEVPIEVIGFMFEGRLGGPQRTHLGHCFGRSCHKSLDSLHVAVHLAIHTSALVITDVYYYDSSQFHPKHPKIHQMPYPYALWN